jgi:phosphoribosyl-ATP pyrophosphohydrolase/phosphoribosyl-AMP cyclohydrolase
MSDESGAPQFDSKTGLIPAIVQDARSARVLMLGYMNAEALDRTRESGRVTFYSRSREALWTKGETSGNWLEVVEVRPDCDGDALLIRAHPHGPTCHTGAVSCFGDPETEALGEALGDLFRVIEDRRRERPEGSYTAALFDQGISAIARKVGEESVELAVEASAGGPRTVEEAADVFYHSLVLLAALDLTPEELATTLRGRSRR